MLMSLIWAVGWNFSSLVVWVNGFVCLFLFIWISAWAEAAVELFMPKAIFSFFAGVLYSSFWILITTCFGCCLAIRCLKCWLPLYLHYGFAEMYERGLFLGKQKGIKGYLCNVLEYTDMEHTFCMVLFECTDLIKLGLWIFTFCCLGVGCVSWYLKKNHDTGWSWSHVKLILCIWKNNNRLIHYCWFKQIEGDGFYILKS